MAITRRNIDRDSVVRYIVLRASEVHGSDKSRNLTKSMESGLRKGIGFDLLDLTYTG